ncbi:hypothetical protein Vadar_007788 [Vaccinium darrowii]|uniref:Uncharacterized protein n=1 Tax=Vaccinium darrowii TaxID=229202 RepID=A0ACB7WYK4_9ERIC|nr:hypothetical protein Vadar_007788 [Vaccinium darrowii]
MIEEGSDSVAEAKGAVLESLSSYGSYGLWLELILYFCLDEERRAAGAAGRVDKLQHLYAGFTVWLSRSEPTAEKEEPFTLT